MEHNQALETHAADLYVLGELSDADAEAFEEHFFDCVECADEVRLGRQFLDGGRDMIREDEAANEAAKVVPIASRKRASVWMPVAAAAVLAILIGTPVLLQRTRGPIMEVGHGHPLTLSEMRSAAPPDAVTVRDGELTVLYVEIAAQGRYARYEVRLLDAKGKQLDSRPVSTEEAKDMIPLGFRGLDAGTYELVVVGVGPAGQYAEVTRAQFTVKRQGPVSSRRERWSTPTTQARLARAA